MKQTKIIMGMPIEIEITDQEVSTEIFKELFNFFRKVDKKFSTYKNESEISKINQGKISKSKISKQMQLIFNLSEQTSIDTDGFFNIQKSSGEIDPSGIVKGWAILEAFKILKNNGFNNFYINAGGDIQTSGKNKNGEPWKVGIKNPFNKSEFVKVINLKNEMAVATSGSYERGAHIYNPKNGGGNIDDILSLTVVGPDILEADRFATAAFAMGAKGIEFIENKKSLEGYMINKQGIATYTSGFANYL